MREKNKSTLIAEEIENLRQRRAEILSKSNDLRGKLDNLSDSAVNGNFDLSEMANFNSEIGVLEKVISDIDLKIDNLQTDLETARESESRQLVLNKMVRIANDAKKLSDELSALFIGASKFLSEFSAKASLLIPEIAKLQRAFRERFLTLQPKLNQTMSQNLPEVNAEIESILTRLETKADLSAVRSQIFNPREHRLDDSINGYKLPESEFNPILLASVDIAGKKVTVERKSFDSKKNDASGYLQGLIPINSIKNFFKKNN